MGICSSCESSSVTTAKLILQDGRLQEFSYPVKASYVMQKDPSSFICNSDEMEFDVVVSPIGDDEELQPGQLYFVLPASRLRHPLQAEEMAALAVKASAALMKSGGDKCQCSRKPFCPGKGVKAAQKVADCGGGTRRGRNGGGGGCGRRRSFEAELSAIPE